MMRCGIAGSGEILLKRWPPKYFMPLWAAMSATCMSALSSRASVKLCSRTSLATAHHASANKPDFRKNNIYGHEEHDCKFQPFSTSSKVLP